MATSILLWLVMIFLAHRMVHSVRVCHAVTFRVCMPSRWELELRARGRERLREPVFKCWSVQTDR